MDRESLEVDSDMPTIESFPFKLSASNAEGSHSQTTSVLASASLPPPVESLKVVESMTGMEIMMRRLLKEQDDRNEDWHRRQQEETKRTIESVIATHVQLLNTAIAHERTARTQAISEIQTQLQGL